MTQRPTVKSKDLTPTQPFIMPWPTPVTADDPLTPPERCDPGSDMLPEMAAAFPNCPFAEAYIEAAVEAVSDAERFSAIALRIVGSCRPADAPETAAVDSVEITRLAATVLEARNGFWGMLEPDVIGGVFANGDGRVAETAAEVIRESLERLDAGAVTTGVAEFPSHGFGREETIANARKAVDHAAFFGPGSCVRFDAVSLNVSGDIRYQDGDVDGAVAEFERALALDPVNVNVHNSLGVCHGLRGDYKRALRAFEAALDADPDEVTARYNVGLIHLLEGNTETALDHFQAAAQRGDDVFEIQFQTGKLLTELGRDDDAIDYLQKAIQLGPESGPAHRFLGAVHDRGGQPEKALGLYKKAIRLHPNDAESLSALGRIYAARGENIDICITFCRQSVDIEPEEGGYRLGLAELYRQAGRDAEALEQYRSARELGIDCDPDIAELEQRMTRAAS